MVSYMQRTGYFWHCSAFCRTLNYFLGTWGEFVLAGVKWTAVAPVLSRNWLCEKIMNLCKFSGPVADKTCSFHFRQDWIEQSLDSLNKSRQSKPFSKDHGRAAGILHSVMAGHQLQSYMFIFLFDGCSWVFPMTFRKQIIACLVLYWSKKIYFPTELSNCQILARGSEEIFYMTRRRLLLQSILSWNCETCIINISC